MAQEAVGSAGNPVVDVSYSGDLLTVTYSDGTSEGFTVAGGSGVDQTARTSAQTAQARADSAYTTAEGAETTAGEAEATADNTEAGLEGHIDQHPGAVVSGPPGDGTVTRSKLSPALRADVDAHADLADLVAHEASPHAAGLTASTITGLDEGDPHSNVEIPGVHSGVLAKYSFGRLIQLVASSVGLGPRINPTPAVAKANETVVMNAGGDGYTTRDQPFIPQPVNGQIIIGSGPIYSTTRLPTRADSFPHVSRIPVATADSPEVVYLDHPYHEGGVRRDATLRIGSDGNLSGYIDPRLGATIGSINEPSPVIRIQVLIGSDGTTIERWNTLEVFEQSAANEFDRVFLNNAEYQLGIPFAQSGVWKRRFLTEPSGFQIDTNISFNLRRLDNSSFFTDGSGVRFNPGLWQKYVVRDGLFAYDHLSGPRIAHTDGVGEPLQEPTRNGEFYVDNLAQTWVGLVDRHTLTTPSAVTTAILQFDQYLPAPGQLSDLLNSAGVAGFTWIPTIGERELIQALSATPGDIDQHRSWIDTWTLVAAQHPQQTSPNEYADAIANRDAVWLGGFHDPESAADEASHIINQADYDAGRRIFYGHAGGGTQGIYRFTSYVQGTVTSRSDGHWVGPFATIADIERIANDVLDDATKPVADEAAAIADGDRMGVLYLFPGGTRYNGTTYTTGGGGGAPAAFEGKLPGEVALSGAIDVMATVLAASLTAGKKYRITGSIYVRALGGTTHNLDGYLYAGGVQIATGETVVDPEGSTQARFSMLLDTLYEMPNPAIDISLRAKEGAGDTIIGRPPTGLIVMEVT